MATAEGVEMKWRWCMKERDRASAEGNGRGMAMAENRISEEGLEKNGLNALDECFFLLL